MLRPWLWIKALVWCLDYDTIRYRVVGHLPAMLRALQTATAPELIALLLRFELAEPLLLALKEQELVSSKLDASQPFASHDVESMARSDSPLQPPQPSDQPRTLQQGQIDPPKGVSIAAAAGKDVAPETDLPPDTDTDADLAAAAIASYCKHHQLATEEALKQWCFRHALSSAALLAEAQHLHNRQALTADSIPGSEESLFLRFKDRLDRVLYGLIRVDNGALARDLFFAIEAGELRFGEAARLHSCGPEARTEGIVGPVDLTTPHPEISSRLRMASPGELILPFKLEQWHIILRLDYRFEASLDQDTRHFLRDLSLRSQAREAIEPELVALAAWAQEVGQGSAR